MTELRDLADLERTIGEIAVELLLLDKERRYPHLILGDPENKTSVRISMHYVMALLAYGFGPDEPEMQRAADWFDTPFPKHRGDHIDPAEMNRLHCLIYLRPQNENVQSRLKQLSQQQERGYYDVQPGWHAFDTLWALKIFARAKQASVLDENLVKTYEMRAQIDHLLTNHDLKMDKDIALALRLQYELSGDLEPRHEDRLRELIEVAQANKGLWGLGELGWQKKDMGWYQQITNQQPVMYEDVRSHQRAFRKIMVSTCMAVEYLMPLVDDYPELKAVVEQALRLWWNQFKGEQAISTLRTLFPRPNDYDYLLMLCRTLRAVREYVRKPLRTLDTVPLLRQLTEIKTDLNEPYEIRSIKRALRSWIQIDLLEQVEPLRLGFSDANVVRVRPYIWSPLTAPDEEPESLVRHSLIIKYGPAELIESERRHYENVPAAIRDYFVRIPESSYTDSETGLAFVIMQDLRDYKTLYESQEAICRNINQVGDMLGNFLERMHDGGSSQSRLVPRSLMREIYLSRMIEHIDRVFDFIWEHRLFEDRAAVSDIQHALFEAIGRIVLRQRDFERFPAAYMHGDLHMRNIMIRGVENLRSMRGQEMVFKLIDLEFLRSDGDAAFDAGELLMDIELVSREERKGGQDDELVRLSEIVGHTYQQFAERRRDSSFGVRVELARARTLLRIAKGKTKRGTRFVRQNQPAMVDKIAEDLVKHAAEALQYLQNVANALN